MVGYTNTFSLDADMSVVQNILEKIEKLTLEEGARIPSERSLAESCGVSRTSMRNALKDLQSRRILEVKQGSGYFLSSQFALEQAISGEDTFWSLERVRQTMEARRHVEPHVIALSIGHLEEVSIERIESCLIALGEATVGHNISAAVSLHRCFFKHIYNRCPNREFIRILNEVRIPADITIKAVKAAEYQERNALFSEHVNLFQQIRQQEAEGARLTCAQINRLATDVFLKYHNLVSP